MIMPGVRLAKWRRIRIDSRGRPDSSGTIRLVFDEIGPNRIFDPYETECPVARKSKEKTTEVVGLLGLGLDNQDGHKRITKAEDILLVGGSQETHERMQDVAIRVSESLKDKGKRLQDASPEEVFDIVQRAMDR